MRILLAGAAALAMAASGTYASPGQNPGKDKSPRSEMPSKAERPSPKGKSNGKPPQARQQDNRGKPQQARSPERQQQARPSPKQERRVERAPAPRPGPPADKARERQADLQRDRLVEQRRVEQRRAEQQRQDRYRDQRDDRRENFRPLEYRGERQAERRPDRRTEYRRGYIVDRVSYDRDRRLLVRDRGRHMIAGCPPGLARKGNGCLPPGQARKRDFRYERWNGYDYRPRLFGLSNYQTGRYYYDNGYLLRPSDNGGIAGYIPLLGGALSVGNPWPSSYNSYAVPDYYVDYYDLGPTSSYRYADNVIYRVNPDDSAISSVVALLTGDDFAIGQPMPSGYDVYNVPYAYRDRYRDTPDQHYRYSDGYVYQVDPTTQLITAAINLLV